MAQQTIRHLQIFRNDGYPLIGAPDVIKTRVETLLSDSSNSGLNIKDGEFIDIRYYKGRYELSQGATPSFVWRVLVVESGTSSYIDPSVSGNITRIQTSGVITGLVGVGISTNNNQLNTTGQANAIQWVDEGGSSSNVNVESGSNQSDVVKVYVTENPDGNFIVTSAIDWTNLASHLTFSVTQDGSGNNVYTLKGGDDTSSLNVELASFTITPGGNIDNYVQKASAIYGVIWGNLTTAEQNAWDTQYKLDVDNDGTTDYALWYSGCVVGGNTYTNQSDFISDCELANKGRWLLKLEIGTSPTQINSIVYVSIPDFTYLVRGAVDVTTDELTLTNDDGSTVVIDISALKNINAINGDHFGTDTSDAITGNANYVRVKATTTTNVSTGEKSTALVSETRNSAVTYAGDGIAHTAANDVLSATDGLLTHASVQSIEHYIDQYDCGTYTISLT